MAKDIEASNALSRAHSRSPQHRTPRRFGLLAAAGAMLLSAASSAHLGGFEAADGYAPFLNMVQNYNAGQYGANSCNTGGVQMPIAPNSGSWEALSGGFSSGGSISYATGHFARDRTYTNTGGSSGSFNDQGLVLTTGHEGWNGPPLKYKYNLEACDLDGCEPADTGNTTVSVSFWVCWQLAGPEIGGQLPDGYYGDEIEFLDSTGNVGFKVGLTQRASGDKVTYWNGTSLFESAMVGASSRYDRWEVTLDLAADTVTAVFTPFSTGVPVTVVSNVAMMSAMSDFSAMTFRTSPGVNNQKLMSIDDFEFDADCDEPCEAELIETYCLPDDDGDGLETIFATIKVTNNSGIDATKIRITPLPTGSPVVVQPNEINQFVSGNGGMHTFNVTFDGLMDQVEFCFVVTLVDETGNTCCSVVVCFTPDCDCLQIRDEYAQIMCSPDGIPGKYIYTFQFDNLTQDTIHHVYFNPPTGVMITPNYIPLVPPVGPGQTSQPIMIMFMNATPGTILCFDIDIHDELLNQCCRQEVCVEIPFCDGGMELRGACCFEEPGLPQPGCIVTTAADCAQTYNGVYMGDNTVCNPNPCIPDPGDTTTHLTAFARCCIPDDEFAISTLTICNNSTISRDYMWSLESIVTAECPVAIDPSFINPGMGSVTLLPGECIDIPIRITCEGTIGNMGMSCLEATVTDLTSNTVYTSTGKVTTDILGAGGQLPPWCIEVSNPDDPTISYPRDAEYLEGRFLITNNTMSPEIFSFMINGGGTLSIDGFPSGVGIDNFVRVEPGETLPILYGVTLTEDRPAEVFDAVLYSDLDGDGDLEPLISQAYQSAAGEPCAGDTNNDNVVNFTDLNTILTCFGLTGEPGHLLGDLDRNGLVDFADLNIVLSNFGTGCN